MNDEQKKVWERLSRPAISPWFAPAGYKRGELHIFMASRRTGKSMLQTKYLEAYLEALCNTKR